MRRDGMSERHAPYSNAAGDGVASGRPASSPNRRSGSYGAVLAAAAGVALLATGIFSSSQAPAQGSGWGWIPWGDQRPPPQREPPRQPAPQPPPSPGFSPAPPFPQASPGQSFANRPPICVQLEQRLHAESRNSSVREALPRIENDMRTAERAMRTAQEQLERSNCYEYEFLMFGKQLRRTPACQSQAQQVETNRRRLADLDVQRQQIVQSGGRSLQDDLVRELARNNCGPAYAQQAARLNTGPWSGLWQDEESGPGGGNRFNYGATFRTVCVRLCDGAFFPVSFSTLQSQFDRDQELCQSRCAAPAELYYHPQSPKDGIETAVSFKTRQPYTTLRTAFRYRKEFVQGCSCKANEFTALPGTPGASPAPATASGDRRIDAVPASGGPASWQGTVTPPQPPRR
jgi:hypothetical protein